MKINNCRSCNSKNLLSIISLGNQYLSDFVKINKKPKSFPLNLMLCKDCFLVQLDFNAPQKYLYTERYGYKSGINQTMQVELKGIAKDVVKKLGKRKENICVLDIGSNDGTLIKNYPKSFYKICVEPIKKFAKESKQFANLVINDFFSYKAVSKVIQSKKADVITIISCFYDMEKPNDFISDVKKLLKDDGIIVIQQNYIVKMLEQNAFDNIVHEHLEYYSLYSLSKLLEKHNLEVFDVEERELNGGSFRTYIALKGRRKISKTVLLMQQKESLLGLNKKDIYLKFAKRISQNKIKLRRFIQSQIRNGKTIYLYGASTRGNTLLQYYELNNRLIKKAVERNPEKWGKIIASVGIPIISEETARKERPDFMLILPWFFKAEFLKREKQYLKHGHFIFPLPKFEVI